MTDNEGVIFDTLPIRLLLIEDDESLAQEIIVSLEQRDYKITHKVTGTSGLDAALSENFQLMIIDRMLPELDGLSVLERLRFEGNRVPVLVLSAMATVDDRIGGLKAGGDDYLTKPFAMEELAARLEALLRRPVEGRLSILRAGSLKMDLIERRVWRDDIELELLPREFRLLEYMMRRPNMLLTRTMLLEDVWNYRFVPQTNLVDVHVGKLRRKIDSVGNENLIESIRGSGFCLRVEE